LKNIPKEKVLSRKGQKEYRESTKYNESDHLVNASKENKALYEQIKKRILNLGDNIKVESKNITLVLFLIQFLPIFILRNLKLNYGLIYQKENFLTPKNLHEMFQI